MSHDQNFKNLILDYPRQALELFAEEEAKILDDSARILPIRQEQLKERLGERFRELDVPLLVEWPDGRREAILFVLEEESDPRRFSIHRLAHYCLDLSELYDTERVVPVVIFLKTGEHAKHLSLGGDRHRYLEFHYLSCVLADLPYERYRDSPNIVARLNLPNMQHTPAQRVEVHAMAVRGLANLEPDIEKQIKYLDFIDIYSKLDDNERQQYEQEYQEEAETMSSFAERFIQQGMEQGREQGMEQGMQQGMQLGEARVLTHQLTRKFGRVPDELLRKIDNADEATLLEWSDRVLTANTLEEVIH
jgi:hypothetical protein